MTARTGEGDAAGDARLRRLLIDLDRRPGTEWIELDRLARPAIATIARRILTDRATPEAIDAIEARSDGNPLLVEELARAAARGDAFPIGMREAMQSHLDGLDAPVLTVLCAAASTSAALDERALAVVTGMTRTATAGAVRALLDRHILVVRDAVEGPTLVFRHALLREVVDDALMPVERRDIHRAFAEAGSERPDIVPMSAASLAVHWAAAGEVDRARSAARAAHREALAVAAFDEAARWGRIALDGRALDATMTVEEVDLHRSTAEAALLIGDAPGAVTLLRAAIAAAPRTLERDQRSELHARLRMAAFTSGDLAAAWADAQGELDDLPADARGARAEALAHLAALELAQRRWSEAQAHAEDALAEAEASGVPARIALATGVLGLALVELGDVDGGIAAVRRAWAEAATIGPRGHDLAYRRLVGVLARTGRFGEVVEAARSGREIAKRNGLARTLGRALAADEADALVQLGRWGDAEAVLADTLGETADDDDGDRSRVALARMRLRRDGPVAAAAAVESVRLAANSPRSHMVDGSTRLPTPIRRSWIGAVEIEAEAAILSGRAEDALARLADAADLALTAAGPARSTVETGLALEPAAALAVWAAAERDPAQASRGPSANTVADRVVALVPTPIGPFGAYLGAELARLGGHHQDELERWPSVAQDMTDHGLGWWAAWAYLRLAEVRARGGDALGAADPVAEASRIADQLPSVPLRTAVDRLARRLGLVVPRRAEAPTHAVPGPLTAREHEVLELVVAGYANREIADRLAISHKTASVHVSNILGKLAVANRTEAASVAVRLGLVDVPSTPAHDD